MFPIKLTALFLLTAVLYASVGFGGGSTYSALLVLAKTEYSLLPSISLICNIIVVTGGTWRFHQKKHIPWQRIWPLMALSVPMAWLGGYILIDESLFILMLGLALLVAGITMLIQNKEIQSVNTHQRGLFIPFTGAGLGFLSGMVGIGGGIFLAPVLHLFRWATSTVIAGVCSAFILVNSIAGLGGQMMKLSELSRMSEVFTYWPLFIAVFVGGYIGSLASTDWLPPRTIKLLTSALILLVAIRLLSGLLLTGSA